MYTAQQADIPPFPAVHQTYTIASQRAALWLVAWHSGNAFHPINEVALRQTGLVLRRVTACGSVNHLGM